MTTNFVSIDSESSITKLISLIEKHNLREVLVTENKKLKGIVYSKNLAKKGIQNPDKMKINSIMNFPPPSLEPESDVNEAAKLLLKTGLRALPVIENSKVSGILSMSNINDFASKTKEFKQARAESIMSVPEVIGAEEDIGKARFMMREKNISRLPVVDKNNKVMGILTIFDLLKAVKPVDRVNFYSLAGEKETTMKIPISTIVNSSPVIVNKDSTLNEVVNVMNKYSTDGVLVMQGQSPAGIVTAKDLLEFFVSGFEQKGVYYQIIGLVNEDEFITSTVDRMVRDTLQKLSKMYNLQFFFLHVKRHDKEGKVKYSIRTRLLTDAGTFISKSYAWDLRTAVDDAMHKLQRISIKEKEFKSEKSREKARYKRDKE
jgi:CBS domain-containing protein